MQGTRGVTREGEKEGMEERDRGEEERKFQP